MTIAADSASPLQRRGRRILVVDDDDDHLAAVAVALRREGHAVDIALSGQAALSLVRGSPPDLALLDIDMPDMNGFELCQAMRRICKAAPHVIFVTGSSDIESLERGFDLGGVDFVTKPFRMDELMIRVESAIRAKSEIDRLMVEAATDPLTGVWNRHHLDRRLAEAISVAGRSGRPLAVLLLDLDNFKDFNDRHGHAVGDEVLRESAARMTEVLRGSDVLYRYGGEEFLVVAVDASPRQSLAMGQRLRAAIAARPYAIDGTGPAGLPRVTASVGIAEWRRGLPVEQLLARADRALYSAKRDGRDRVVVWGPALEDHDAEGGSTNGQVGGAS